MSPKKKPRKGSGSVSSASTASQDDVDDISIELATLQTRMATMEKNMEAVTKRNEALTQRNEGLTAELAVARGVIVQLQQREATLQAELDKLRERPPPALVQQLLPDQSPSVLSSYSGLLMHARSWYSHGVPQQPARMSVPSCVLLLTSQTTPQLEP